MSSELKPTPHDQLRNYPIRTIVAGTRDYDDYEFFSQVISEQIAEYDQPFIFISGKAKTGADALIIRYCQQHRHPWAEFPARWDDLDAPSAVVRYRDGKPYNVKAGYDRNIDMGNVGTNLIVFWDQLSKGTKQMRDYAISRKLKVLTILIDIVKKGKENGRQSTSGRGSDSEVHREAPAW